MFKIKTRKAIKDGAVNDWVEDLDEPVEVIEFEETPAKVAVLKPERRKGAIAAAKSKRKKTTKAIKRAVAKIEREGRKITVAELANLTDLSRQTIYLCYPDLLKSVKLANDRAEKAKKRLQKIKDNCRRAGVEFRQERQDRAEYAFYLHYELDPGEEPMTFDEWITERQQGILMSNTPA